MIMDLAAASYAYIDFSSFPELCASSVEHL